MINCKQDKEPDEPSRIRPLTDQQANEKVQKTQRLKRGITKQYYII